VQALKKPAWDEKQPGGRPRRQQAARVAGRPRRNARSVSSRALGRNVKSWVEKREQQTPGKGASSFDPTKLRRLRTTDPGSSAHEDGPTVGNAGPPYKRAVSQTTVEGRRHCRRPDVSANWPATGGQNASPMPGNRSKTRYQEKAGADVWSTVGFTTLDDIEQAEAGRPLNVLGTDQERKSRRRRRAKTPYQPKKERWSRSGGLASSGWGRKRPRNCTSSGRAERRSGRMRDARDVSGDGSEANRKCWRWLCCKHWFTICCGR